MRAITLRNSNDTWAPWILFVVTAAIYLCFPTRNYYWDGIAFAQTIEDAPQLSAFLVHPNHLIYNIVGYVSYRAVQALGLNVRAITVLQVLNGILSAISCALLFRILKQITASTYYAFTLSLLFAFSAAWWKFSTDADAYIPSILFLLLSFNLVLPNRQQRPLLVALIYSMSLCFHQIAIIVFPTLVLAFLLDWNFLPRRQRIVNALTFSGAAALITLTAYISSFYLLTGAFRPARFMRWIMSYSADESFGFHPWNNLAHTLRGHLRLFLGGRLNALEGLLNPFLAVLIVILVALLLILAFKIVRHFKNPGWQWLRALRQDPLRRTLALLCLLWISTYVIFLFLLFSAQTFYRLFYLPAIIILLGLVLHSYNLVAHPKRKYRLALFVAVLAIANFLNLIFPYSQVQKYPPLALTLEMHQVWPPGTVIYFGAQNSDNSLVKYINRGTLWKELDPTRLDVIENELRETNARGRTVWLEASAIDRLSSTPEGAEWLRRHAHEESRRSLVTKAHNMRFIQIVPSRNDD